MSVQTITVTMDLNTYNDMLAAVRQRDKNRENARKNYVKRNVVKPEKIFQIIESVPTTENDK